MKKILFFAAIITSLIAQSCSKSTDDLTTTSFNIEEAKMSFVNNFNNALSTKSSDEAYYSLAGGDYTPIWEMAKANENEYIWSLEVPIMSDLQVVLKNNVTDVITGADRRLLFIKSKETHLVSSFIMVSTTAETKSSSSNYEHLAENTIYSGYVLYSTLAGEFVNLCFYDNGVEKENINALDVKDSNDYSFDEMMGEDEFGIMLSDLGKSEYYEGFCLGCGAPYPDCWCDWDEGNPVTCLSCGENYLTCKCEKEICEKCGQVKIYSSINGLICDCFFTNEDIRCEYCGEKHLPNNCKYICPTCSCHLSQCKCK